MFSQSRILVLSILTILVPILGCQQGAEQAKEEATPPPPPGAISALPSPEVVDPVIATVNGEEVHQSDLLKQINTMARQGRRISPQEAIDQAISERLLLQAAAESGEVVDATEVEKAYNSVVLRAGGEEQFQKQLAGAKMTLDDVREDIERQMLLQKTLDSKTAGKVDITDASLEAFYAENPEAFESAHARHILIKSAPTDPEDKKTEARGRMEAIAERIKGGEDFAEVAKAESEGPSAPRGGDLGQFGRGRMVPAFEEAVFSMEPGQVSDIVETQFGYHLIEVLERKTIPLEEVRDRLQKELENRQRNQIIGQWLEELKEKATIEMTAKAPTAGLPPIGSSAKTDF